MVKSSSKIVQRPGAGRRKTEAPALGRISPADGISTERQVYETLRYAFMSGAVYPGSSLSSRSLSEELGVSPTPVREALKRLDGDGAVVSRNKSAFFVYDPDKTELSELFEVRLMLEGRAIRRAASRVNEDDVQRLRALNDDYQRILEISNRPGKEALQANYRFHFEIYRLSGSKVLLEMIEAIWVKIGPALHHYVPVQGDTSIANFHGGMLDALSAGDADAAELALHADLGRGFETIEPLLVARATGRG